MIAQQLGHTMGTLINTYSHWMKDHAAHDQLLRVLETHAPQGSK